MGKFLLKVSAITIVAAAVVLLVVGLAVAVFFPSAMSSVLGKLNFFDASKIYAEQEYNKRPTFENLVKLSDAAIKSGDDDYIVKYSGKLLNSDEIGEYVDKMPDGDDYFDFVATNYVVSLEKTDVDYSAVIDCAIELSFTEKAHGGGEFGAVEALIAEAADGKDANKLLQLKDKLTAFKPSCAEKYKVRLDKDTELVERALAIYQ